MSSKRRIWSAPWGYAEAWLIVCGLLLVSYLWQWLKGSIPQGGFVHPVSTLVMSLLLVVSVWIGWRASKGGKMPALVRFVVSPAATITSLVLLMAQMLIMGFSTQIDPRMAAGLGGLFHSSGWSAMIHSYPFNISYLYLLLVLGAVTVRRMARMRLDVHDIGFMLNHLGLYGFLAFALISGSHTKRYTMSLTQDEVEWRAIPQGSTDMAELPIALELKHFTLEEYPPKLMLLDGATGEVLPVGAPDVIHIEETPIKGRLADWEVEVEELIPLAAPIVGDSAIVFSRFASMGGAPAAKVRAEKGGAVYSGWASCGSYQFPHIALTLEGDLSVVMPYPEVRQYYATLNYYLQSGEAGEKTISVNDPLRVGDWYVYQLNFDQEKRRWATSTEVELVYDPWLTPVLVSIWVLFVGALFLLLGPANSPTKVGRKEEKR
ncbi:MAG: cytochrome c biogenesis protein ResB [Porphyromonas sp.]|nr:cytochrome c biogenesis protein ResB [Porphyromonas sp.]